MSGIKHKDLKPCLICGLGMAHAGSLAFFRMRLDRMIIDSGAVRRAHGLEVMLGNAYLANIMGPDEDLARQFTSDTVLICEPCALRRPERVFALYEKIAEGKKETADAAES